MRHKHTILRSDLHTLRDEERFCGTELRMINEQGNGSLIKLLGSWNQSLKLINWFTVYFLDSFRIMWFVLSAVKSSPPNAAYMHQWIASALVQIMVCRLFGAKPLSKPMLCAIVNWSLRNKFQRNFSQKSNFKKACLKMSSAKWRPFCPGKMS